jgi:hypothetical protein
MLRNGFVAENVNVPPFTVSDPVPPTVPPFPPMLSPVENDGDAALMSRVPPLRIDTFPVAFGPAPIERPPLLTIGTTFHVDPAPEIDTIPVAVSVPVATFVNPAGGAKMLVFSPTFAPCVFKTPPPVMFKEPVLAPPAVPNRLPVVVFLKTES